MSSFSLLVVIR